MNENETLPTYERAGVFLDPSTVALCRLMLCCDTGEQQRTYLRATEHDLAAVLDALPPERRDAVIEKHIVPLIESWIANDARNELARQMAQSRIRTLEAELATIRADDQPWNLRSCLEKLTDAAEHLLADHSCDAHGHEETRAAMLAARGILAAFPSATVPSPVEPPGGAGEVDAKLFMGLPERWYDGGKFRCVNGHVSTTLLKSSTKGRVCLGCYEHVLMTFPEDEEGNAIGAEVFATRYEEWRKHNVERHDQKAKATEAIIGGGKDLVGTLPRGMALDGSVDGRGAGDVPPSGDGVTSPPRDDDGPRRMFDASDPAKCTWEELSDRSRAFYVAAYHFAHAEGRQAERVEALDFARHLMVLAGTTIPTEAVKTLDGVVAKLRELLP